MQYNAYSPEVNKQKSKQGGWPVTRIKSFANRPAEFLLSHPKILVTEVCSLLAAFTQKALTGRLLNTETISSKEDLIKRRFHFNKRHCFSLSVTTSCFFSPSILTPEDAKEIKCNITYWRGFAVRETNVTLKRLSVWLTVRDFYPDQNISQIISTA